MNDAAQTALVVPGRGCATATGRGSAALTAQYLSGPSLLDDLGSDLDDLHHATGTAVTARSPWLHAWLAAYRPDDPWAIAVREGHTGRLAGVALLRTRARAGYDEILPLGRRQLDRGFLPARTAAAAEVLGAALATSLASRSRPWVLRVGQLPAGDRVAAGIVRCLQGARTIPGLPIPTVDLRALATADDCLGKGLRRQLRKARNRVAGDDLALTIGFHSSPDDVESLLGEVEHTHRAREHHARRVSDLESTPGLRFWRTVIVGLARRREVEIATLRLGGELAAYVVSILDGDTYRVFDGRFAPSWARFSPGRLLETATLERAIDDPGFRQLDWMNGCASEKLLATNAADPTEHLVAAASGMVVDLDVIGRAPVDVDHRTASNLASGAR